MSSKIVALIILVLTYSSFVLSQSINSELLQIEISNEKEEFIQGESIDILIKIWNNTDDTLKLPRNHHLYQYDNDSTYSSQGKESVILPPAGTYYYILDPADWLMFLGRMDTSNFTLKPGTYDYWISSSFNKKKFSSNKIPIKINPVPDSLQQTFSQLKIIRYMKLSFEDALQLLSKYKGSVYEKRFYRKFFNNRFVYNAIKNKNRTYREESLKIVKEYILKYPATNIAYGLLQVMMFNAEDNHKLIEDIIKTLKETQPDCALLEVLRNQRYFVNSNIKHLLD